ncbi:MAG: cytochrome P450 [Novosphingobium sp.]
MAAPADSTNQVGTLGDIVTPRSKPSITSTQALPALAARLGAGFAGWSGRVLRLGDKVFVARHADVLQVLQRDLDFRIAPINQVRIDEVNGPFILGMDRGARLADERGLLYRALARVDLAPLAKQVVRLAVARIAEAGADPLDVVGGYARPIAARTATALFGVTGSSPEMLMEVARAVFAHTFLNLGGDETVRQRALRASRLMGEWITAEVARRIAAPDPGSDLMGQLIRLQREDGRPVDADLVRRQLGGMLVGSIDTTASCVAKIIAVIGADKELAAEVARDVDAPERLRGWCWEALRRWPHNPVVLREAVAATTLNGQEIKPGDRIFAWTQAAMLDATAFPDPLKLRPDRPEGNYLHFGGALHACAGRAVNQFQIPILVGAILRRGLASVGKMDWAGPFPDRLMAELTR